MYELHGFKRRIEIRKEETVLHEYTGSHIDYMCDLIDINNYLLKTVMDQSIIGTIVIRVPENLLLSDLISFLDIFLAYNQEMQSICIKYFYKDPRLYELFDNISNSSDPDQGLFFLSEENPGFDRMEYLQVRIKNEQIRATALKTQAEKRLKILDQTEIKFNALLEEKDREIKLVLEERNAFCKRFKATFLNNLNGAV